MSTPLLEESESDEIFRHIVEDMPDAMLLTDVSQRIVWANARTGKLLGYTREALMGLFINAIVPGSYALRADGSEMPIEIIVSPLSHPRRALTLYTLRDITGHRHAAEELVANEELLRQFIKHTPAAIAMLDTRMCYIQASDRWIQDYHLTEKNIIGKSHYEIFPDVPQRWKEIHQRVLGGAVERCNEDPFPRDDGQTEWLKWEARPWRKAGGEISGVIFFTQVITERKRAEASHARLVAILESTTDMVSMCEITGQLFYMNRAGRLLLGVGLDEDITSAKVSDFHPSPEIERVRTEGIPTAIRMGTWSGESILLSRDGREIPISQVIISHRSPDGSIDYLSTVIRDVTEERRREKKLTEALALEKELRHEAQSGSLAKNQFLAVMSHEIRTPMTGILGFAELLAEAPNLPEDCRGYARTIAGSGESLLRILDDILVFSRLEAGGLRIEHSTFSPSAVICDIHALLAPAVHEKRLDLRMEIDPAIPESLCSDAGRLRQVLLNLTGNAIKFTEHGCITIGCRPTAPVNKVPAVEFFVRDTGKGISDSEMRYIFEPFAQADSSISRQYGGTGLGLAISQHLVQLMGGKLGVFSESGKGSEFYFTIVADTAYSDLPVSDISAPLRLDESFAASHPLRILLVEDDKVSRSLILLMLQKLGYEPLIATDGIQALEVCRTDHPDCILMDLQMPRMDGLESTRTIREYESSDGEKPPIFIAALTANILAEDQQRCIAVGMNAYMNKPIHRPRLAEILMQASSGRTNDVRTK